MFWIDIYGKKLTYFEGSNVAPVSAAGDVIGIILLHNEPFSDVGPYGEGEAPLQPLGQAEADEGAEEDDPAPTSLWGPNVIKLFTTVIYKCS